MSEMEIPISKTKIILPKRRVEILSRKRLLDAMYESLDRKLIMVSAPAGYGKTSLLIDLAYQSILPFSWLALDPLDRDPQRFIAYVIAALKDRFSKFGNRSSSALNAMTSLEDGMERLLVTLVNEIYDEIQEHFVLVLDDYHLLDDVQPIQYFINRFIQLVGENCHLVLSSRSLPNLPDLPLLVARDQVGGIGFTDLSFRAEEIQALLAQNQQIHLSDEEAGKLFELTEGWVTGLQFTDLDSLRRSGGRNYPSTKSTGITIFDYLGQQVLERQPDALRLFLLRSSLLEEFDAKLCEAVLSPLYPEPQDWPRILETIAQKNLFVLPVGSHGQWLRYHHLFRDYLQERLRREFPEEVTPILQRLATSNETRGEWEKAYQIYRMLGDINALANMIERNGTPMYQHAALTLEAWLKDLPPSLLQNRPGLLSLRGAIESFKGNTSEAVSLFSRAIGKFRDRKDIPGLALALVRRGNAYRLLGDYKESNQDAEEAMRLTEGNDDLQWNYADALRVKGLSLYRRGQTVQAANYLEAALDIYIRLNDVPTIPILLMETGLTYATTGNYSQAKSSYEKALNRWRRIGNLNWQSNLLNNLGVLHHQQGEYELAAQVLEEGLLCAKQSSDKRMEALTAISLGDLYTDLDDYEIAERNYRQVEDVVQQLRDPFLINYLALAEIKLAILRDDLAQARDRIDQVAASIRIGDSDYEHGLYQFTHGRLLLMEGKLKEAAMEFTKAKKSFMQDGREMEGIWSRIWLAAVEYQIGDKEAARNEIKATLQNPTQINHSVVVAARQAYHWLKDLRDEPEVRKLVRNLFERVDRMDDQLPRIRRQVRRLARTIEIPAPHLVISAFGSAQVQINGRLITMADWQTQSVKELFFYFLAAERPLTKEQIGGVLWPETVEPSKLKLRFKNEIYRLRRAVGQDIILFDHEYYQFKRAVDHEYDVEAFEAYVAKAKSSIVPEEQIELYQKATALVRGSYLEDFGATWVLPERERLNQVYLSALLTLSELYQREGQVSKALFTCQRALAYDPTSEAVYRQMMYVYHRMGDRPSIIHVYETCEKTMRRVFDLTPSEETQRLYHNLIL